MEELIKKLQSEAKQFLTKSKLVLNGVEILPKEIEVYYYKEGVFEDISVHKNELQTKKHKSRFYVHRLGEKQSDPYKGANRAGVDYVVSDDANTYYSYLIRSAVINGESVIGPNKVLIKIKEASKFENQDLERELVKIVISNNEGDVLFSSRINLGKGFVDSELRAVLCDECFRTSKYPAKEKMIIDFIKDMSKVQALEYAKNRLGYIPASIR